MKILAGIINSDKNMTDNKTTPEQFVKEWLPEYLRKWVEFYYGEILPFRPMFLTDRKIERRFVEYYFPEALEAFARHVWDQACRECAQVYDECQTKGDYRPSQIINKIERIPAPEFKLTENEYE